MNALKIFCTIGPSSLNKSFLINLDPKYVKLLRINLSHTNYDELEDIVKFIRRYTSIRICFDTEGAQIRTSVLKKGIKNLKLNNYYYLSDNEEFNDYIPIKPKLIYKQLKKNDILSIDFNSAKIKITKVENKRLKCKVIQEGLIGTNKSIAVNRPIKIPAFTENDICSFEIAKKLNIKDIALSFASKAEDIVKLRQFFNYDINVTSKIESKKGVRNLKNILDETDNILIDRGDLSKEVPLELIPKMQKKIIHISSQYKVPVYVATNLLESMVKSPEPTRAEINDIYNTLLDGANGLVLAAETAIGKYPNRCIHMIIKVAKTI